MLKTDAEHSNLHFCRSLRREGWGKSSHQEQVTESALFIQMMCDVLILMRPHWLHLFGAAMGSWCVLLSWPVRRDIKWDSFDESNVLFYKKEGDSNSQPSRWGGRTSSSQCGRRCCRSKIPSVDTLLSPKQTAGHRSWSAHIRPSCPRQADGHKDTYQYQEHPSISV